MDPWALSGQRDEACGYTPSPFVHRYPPQQIVFERGAARKLAPLLESLGVRRALLVSGSHTVPLAASIIAGAEGRITSAWAGLRPHAPMECIDAAVEAFVSTRADGLVSLGGGSAHDAIRAVSWVVQAGGSVGGEFGEVMERYRDFQPTAGASRIPMVAVPSTLSAAEVTNGGGVTRGGRKYTFRGEGLFIDRIVLDEEIFATTPREILVSTGVNAIHHALERLCAPAHQPIADAAFIHALRLLLPSLQALHRGDLSSRTLSDAMLGAHLSHSANVWGGIGHAIAHVLGARFDMPHGIAHGLGMLPGLRFNGPRSPHGIAIIRSVLADMVPAAREGDPLEAVLRVMAAYLRSLGLPTKLSENGVAIEQIEHIAADVLGDGSMRYATGAEVEIDAMKQLLMAGW